MKRTSRGTVAIVVIAFWVLMLGGYANPAQLPDKNDANPAVVNAQPHLDNAASAAASVADFFDQAMAAKMEQNHIPNAVVAVVKDGQIIYKKGFGQADIEQDIPVDPDTTLFRIGSTSKLITWTAVMQLVEAGRLDLNTDINRYLDFEISPRLEKPLQNQTPAPITMTHLMTHTPGFEDHSDMLFRLFTLPASRTTPTCFSACPGMTCRPWMSLSRTINRPGYFRLARLPPIQIMVLHWQVTLWNGYRGSPFQIT